MSSQAIAEPQPVRVAILKFGTVSWELDVVRRNGLDRAENIELDIVELASGQAAKVALQAGSVDVIVTDWFWVLRARANGGDFVFAPYSATLGDLMLPPESSVKTLADLTDKKIGVAGGPLDKSWLILRILSQKRGGKDLSEISEPVYAAPPLLNLKAEQRELAAVLNYWPYSARLEAKGFKRLVGVNQALAELGVDDGPALVGYTFSAGWANTNKARIEGFLRATDRARRMLYESDGEWDHVRPLMRAQDDATFKALRSRFRAVAPRSDATALQANAERLYSLLSETGGKTLLGPGVSPSLESFWSRP